MSRSKPWVMRTYAGHSSARASNELYRLNLAKGQTGLSIAFDLPTQTGYDPDSPLARGEVGKVGVPVVDLGDMRALLDGIPLDRMNTSMTINATAMWLLALYVTVADEQGADRRELSGTTQNDIIKEYLSRGTYVFPPGALDAADHRHDRVERREHSEVEPDQHLLVPPPGGGRHARAGGRVRDVDGHLGSRRRSRLGAGARGGDDRRGCPDLVLRQCRRALRRGDVQDAGIRPAVGRGHPRALRRHGREGPPLPLRGAGQLARPDRGAAGEQHPAHRAGDARRDAVEERPRACRAAARLERGARPAAPVGSAVEPAHAAGPRARDRPARVRGHLRRLTGRSRPRSSRSCPLHARRWPASRRWAGLSLPSSPAT